MGLQRSPGPVGPPGVPAQMPPHVHLDPGPRVCHPKPTMMLPLAIVIGALAGEGPQELRARPGRTVPISDLASLNPFPESSRPRTSNESPEFELDEAFALHLSEPVLFKITADKPLFAKEEPAESTSDRLGSYSRLSALHYESSTSRADLHIAAGGHPPSLMTRRGIASAESRIPHWVLANKHGEFDGGRAIYEGAMQERWDALELERTAKPGLFDWLGGILSGREVTVDHSDYYLDLDPWSRRLDRRHGVYFRDPYHWP